jgi:uncharacterized membrane protein
MTRILLAFGTTALGFLALDYLWLRYLALDMYRTELGGLLLAAPRPWPAVLFYFSYLVGMLILCVLPGLDAQDWTQAAFKGAVLGLVAYGAYDLTNLATLNGWSFKVTIIDLLWGTVLTSFCSGLAAWSTQAILTK